MADTIRVLYVDDEPGLLDIGKLYLERTGQYTVDTLESAIEALLQLKTKRYDAIISDYQMPDMDGIEFLKQLKASENTTPFIIFTGRGREDVVIQALNEGADFYLQKGGEPKSQFAELSNKIQYAVTRKRAEESLIRKNEELYASYEQITATEEELRTNLDKLTRQEIALKESEERYRSVVNDQTEMIARFTPDGNLTFVNEAYRSYFASLLDIKNVKGHYIREILQVKNYAEVEKFLSSLSQKNPIREIERVVRGKDGEQHWQIWSVRALFSTDDSPVEYQVVGRDITDSILQKNTERELRRSEQRSLAVSMNAGSWIWEVDPDGLYRYTSPAVEQILGYRPDELVGKMHCYDLFDPSMLEEQKATVLAIFNRHEPCRHLVMHGRHRNGTPVVLNTSAIPVVEEDGTFSGYYGINEDITERKRAEEALKMSEIHLAEAMDLAHLVGWEFNVRTGLFTFDDRFYALYGTTVEREGGSQISAEVYAREFVHPEDRDIVVKFVEKTNKKTDLHCVSQLEHRIIRRDGEIRHIVVRVDVTKDAEGRIIKTHGVNQDITERKITESAIQAIVKSMVGSTGLNSLRKITESISAWLGAECVMVGEIQPDNQTVNVLSMFLDGKEIPDFSYTLKGTPCDNVAERGFCLYPDNVIELFPESKDLVELNIRGYIGTPLRNSSGQVCGILCALFRNPIQASPSMQEILNIIAVKASAEIERNQMERALKESQQMLAEAMELAHLVNWEFDATTGIFTFDDRFYALYATTAELEGGNQMSAEEYAKRFLHPDDQDLVIDEVNKALQATDPCYTSQVGHRIIRRDGEIRHIIVCFGITKDENGRTIKTHGANQDVTELLRVENALRESEERYRQLVENLNDIVYTLDNNGIITYVSPVVERQYGYSSSDLIGKPFMDVVFKDDISNIQKRFAEISTGIILPFEWRLKHKDGSHSWVRSSTRPLRDDHGTSGFLGIVSDITREKQAERALRESESFNRGLVENLPEYLSVYGSDGILLYVNPASANAWGFEAEEMVGTHVLSYIPLEYHKQVNANIAVRQKGGDIPPYEIEIITKNASRRSVIVKATPIQYQNKPAILLLLIDITERKRAEDALHKAAQYTRKLIEVSLDSLVTISPEGRITDVNAATEQVTGYSRDYLIGTDFSDYFTDLMRAKEGYRKVFDQGVVLDYPLEIRHKDGKITSVLYNATVYRDGTGKVQGVFAAARDITERKRVEDALKMANQKLSILSSITRHDINNQLAVLTGYLRILEKKQPDPTLIVYSQKVASAAQRISTMILFTKEYEKLGVEGPVWQDIGKISKMAAVDLFPENVDLKVKTGNYEVFADPMFMLGLYNLFENAIRHGVHVTEITLHFIEEESSGTLIIEDNGVGIPAPIKERIFESGFGTNTGFGLYLIRQILPITGLSITETGTEGKGARFEIHLPPGTWRRGSG